MHTLRQENQSRRKLTVWATVVLLASIILIPLLPYTIAAVKEGISNPNPGAQFWRDVRQRDKAVVGSTQVQGVDRGILISQQGEEWRQYRMQQFVPYSAIAYGLVIGLFILYFLVRGKIRIEGGRAGTAIERTTKAERYIHWFAAVTFVLLALTGLILSYGRYVLIPIMGPEGFSGTAAAGKAIHGIVGHLFIGAVIFLFFGFIRDSWIDLKVDAQWILKGGGYLGGGHASAGKFNAGQKAWFWVAILGGVVLIVTGLILDNNADQARVFMQNTHIVHSICSVVVVAFFFVHLYLATVGVEGNLEAMVSGTMDENFVKQHHDLWYEEIKDKSSKSDTSS